MIVGTCKENGQKMEYHTHNPGIGNKEMGHERKDDGWNKTLTMG
jgi:hypothetical protein